MKFSFLQVGKQDLEGSADSFGNTREEHVILDPLPGSVFSLCLY